MLKQNKKNKSCIGIKQATKTISNYYYYLKILPQTTNTFTIINGVSGSKIKIN